MLCKFCEKSHSISDQILVAKDIFFIFLINNIFFFLINNFFFQKVKSKKKDNFDISFASLY